MPNTFPCSPLQLPDMLRPWWVKRPGDLWPFELKSGVQVTCDVGYLFTDFSLPRPLCSRLRPDVCNRRQTKASLNAPSIRGRGHNKYIQYSAVCRCLICTKYLLPLAIKNLYLFIFEIYANQTRHYQSVLADHVLLSCVFYWMCVPNCVHFVTFTFCHERMNE